MTAPSPEDLAKAQDTFLRLAAVDRLDADEMFRVLALALAEARREGAAAENERCCSAIRRMGPGKPTGGDDWEEWCLDDVLETICARGNTK